MPVKDKGVVEKTYKQSDIDNAISQGYQIAEKQYSENIKLLRKQIKELEFKLKLVSLDSATDNNKLDSVDTD